VNETVCSKIEPDISSDVDSNFSLRLEDNEEGENDEWWIVLQVEVKRSSSITCCFIFGQFQVKGCGNISFSNIFSYPTLLAIFDVLCKKNVHTLC